MHLEVLTAAGKCDAVAHLCVFNSFRTMKVYGVRFILGLWIHRQYLLEQLIVVFGLF